MVTQLWSALAGLGLLIILTRILSKEDIGRFALLLGAYEILELFGSLGIPNSLLHFIPIADRQHTRGIGVASTVLLCAVAGVFGLCLFGFAPFISRAFESTSGAPFESLVRWLGLYVALGMPTALTAPYLIATNRALGALRFTVFQQTIRFAAVVIPAVMGAPIETIVISLVVSGALPFVATWWLLLALDRDLPLKPDWSKLGDQLSYGLPQAASVGVQRFNRWVDKYTVGLLMPFDQVGVYTNCSRELPVIRNIPNGATTGLIPELSKLHSRGDTKTFLSLWQGLMVKVALFAFPAFASTFTLASALVEVLFTKEYLSGVGLFRVYLLVLPLRLCIYGGILRAMGDTRTFLKTVAITTALNLALNYPLFLVMGWYGPAVATVVSEVLAIALLVHKSSKYLATSTIAVFPWGALAKTALATTLATLPCWGVSQLELPALLRLFLGALTFLPSYVVLGWWYGVISRDDIRYLSSLLKRG